jgi:hypothetical protein
MLDFSIGSQIYQKHVSPYSDQVHSSAGCQCPNRGQSRTGAKRGAGWKYPSPGDARATFNGQPALQLIYDTAPIGLALLSRRCCRSRWSSNYSRVRQKSWRRLDGHNQLPKLVLGVTFNDGIEVIAKPTDHQPTTAAA